MSDDTETKFQPANFWEATYGRTLNKQELDEIQSNATTFMKFMLKEQLEQKRRKLQVEVFRIDQYLGDLEKDIFPHNDIETLRQRFDSATASMKIKNKK